MVSGRNEMVSVLYGFGEVSDGVRKVSVCVRKVTDGYIKVSVGVRNVSGKCQEGYRKVSGRCQIVSEW